MRRLLLPKPHLEILYSSGCESTKEMPKSCISRGRLSRRVESGGNNETWNNHNCVNKRREEKILPG